AAARRLHFVILTCNCKNSFLDRCSYGKQQEPDAPFANEQAAMPADALTENLYRAICEIPLIDPHSHIDPLRPTARNLDDILGYHYYTELAHSAGMDKAPLAADVSPRERVRTLLGWLPHIDNTVQY